MSRPEKYTDLPEDKRRKLVARFDKAILAHLTEAQIDALTDARAILEKAFWPEVEDGALVFYRPLLPAEQLKALEAAQATWGYYSRLYKAIPWSAPKYEYQRRDLDAWAEKEGLNAIDWDYVDKLEAEAEEAAA